MPPTYDSSDRYSRHLALPEVGAHGQKTLEESRVAIIGLGGLGSPVAMYLAGAGVGKLVLIDPDNVSLSNLHRQIIHSEMSLGKSKTASAAERINQLNHTCTVMCCPTALTHENAQELTADCDVIVDATDNYAARFIISAAAAAHKVPHVYGGIRRFEGQVSVFQPYKGTACYKCLHQDDAAEQHNDESSAEGLLGPLPGIIGSIQALETLKCLLDIDSPLRGAMLTVDTLTMQFRHIKLKSDTECSCTQP